MPTKWSFKSSKLMFVSPWLLAVAIGLLSMIIVILAAKNIQREKDLMTETLFQKGQAIIRFVGAGMRTSRIAGVMGMLRSESEAAQMQFLIEQTSDDEDILYISVIDGQGQILAHSDASFAGKQFDRDIETLKAKKGQIEFNIVKSIESSKKIFEVFGLFEPMRHRGRLFLRRNRQHLYSSPDSDVDFSIDERFILVGLDMTEFENAVRQYRYQIIFLSLVLLLVGLGGWISLLALQGYRVAEQTLNRVQAFTGMLISRLPVGIIATDGAGRIQTFNQAASDLTGHNSEDVIHKKPADVLPSLIADFFSTLPDQSPEHESNEKEIRLQARENKLVSLLVNSVAVYNKDRAYMGIVLLMHDLTALKQLEKQVRRHDRLVALGKMAAGVAHEVRNPLSSIKGFATLLGSKFQQGSKEHEIAGLLVNEAERLNRSITELLNYARPIPLQKTTVNALEFLEKSLQLIHADAESLGIGITLEVAPNTLKLVVDPDRMNQVLLNLYLNALQAMEHTGNAGKLKVTATASGPSVVITIADTGEGISEDVLDQILDPYFTTKPDGTGLGLAIANKIIDEHDGSIALASRKGEGTQVTITLPV
jgi:two-component system sensor histidine kinase HydH